MTIRFGREITGNLAIAESREWLVTNGIGGYGSGSVAGSITRGYHGLLVAALNPPIDRRVMLVKLDEALSYRGVSYDLSTNRWGSDSVAPEGYKNIQSFELEGSVPLWRFACGNALLEKRIWMEHGANTTYVAYTLLAANEPIQLTVRAIVDNRVFHNTGQVAWPASVESITNGVRVRSGGDDARPLVLKMASGNITVNPELYNDFLLPVEATRGLNSHDSHVHAATFEVTISPEETVHFLGSAEDDPLFDADALAKRRDRDSSLLAAWDTSRKPNSEATPSWVTQLVLAADQFVVDRPSAEQPNGKSIIAGYHWFGDWGRDTMISLPGLAISTGRADIAAPILRTFARFVSQGMLPNRFPDATDEPEYNTIDATLWYFQAIRDYYEATHDDTLLRELFPKLQEIIAWHVKGTRYGIQVDPADGLLRGGQDGVQLTWMDAKVGDYVVTPRIGKPIEVNALWYNALKCMVTFAKRLKEPSDQYESQAAAALSGFARYWNPDTNYCFDVLDGPNGHETSLRPNQILAVSLPDSPLDREQQRAVVDICGERLLTSCGLRSLDASDKSYVGLYAGDQYHRDTSYHQGTVWAWLIGPFVMAHWRVYQDQKAIQRILEPLADHLNAAGIGTISEIFDGDPPFTPRGCIAQAWSVGQVLQSFCMAT